MERERQVTDEEVMVYFCSKIKDTDYWETFRNNYVPHILKWGLTYEVLYVAWEQCDCNSTAKHCMDMIALQMDEWDL